MDYYDFSKNSTEPTQICMKNYCAYILANKCRGTLSVGVTGELQRRMIEHKQLKIKGFTQKYDLKMLVHTEPYKYVKDAIRPEKMLKNWRRASKINLIEGLNPE